MSKAMEIVEITPELLETILLTFHTDSERELARKIVALFLEHGLSVKVKQYHQACMKGTYRILCFVKKKRRSCHYQQQGHGTGRRELSSPIG